MKTITETTGIRPSYDLRNISSPEEMLLFDIETTGLRKETTRIYLIGCGYFNADGDFEVRQWLAQSASDEREVLERFVDFAKNYSVLLDFNGDGFDIPYTAFKCDLYGMDFDFAAFRHVDIYKRIRNLKKFLGLERMNQTSIERFLKVTREDVMNGGLLIPYYYNYERTRDPECERLLLLHNSDDVKGMIQMTGALAYADIFDGAFAFSKAEQVNAGSGDVLVLEYKLKNPVPRPVLYQKDVHTSVCADHDLLQISTDIICCEARIPVKNISDYYYLPEEDRIIHKDVAVFVDRRFRKKATVKNCFLKKEGAFVPVFGIEDDTEYLIPDAKGRYVRHIEAENLRNASPEVLERYAFGILEKCR